MKNEMLREEDVVMKKESRRINKRVLMVGLLAAAVLGIGAGVLVKVCRDNAYRQQMLANFKDNGKDEPYANRVPLHEMDFSVYDKYFPQATAPILVKYERKITLPCDVEYYSAKEDSVPAVILPKGTEVYIFPQDGGPFFIHGYGVRCWPDYEKGWRYGIPFLTFDASRLEDVYQDEEIPMYYVKTRQLEKVAEKFYENNPSAAVRIRKSEYVKRAIRSIDQFLYDNGAFLSEELLER